MRPARNDEPRVVAVVQARLGSSRLPGKVLAPIGSRQVLEHVVHRLRRARRLAHLVVALPEGEADHPLADACRRLGVEAVRGQERDVLARYADYIGAVFGTGEGQKRGYCGIRCAQNTSPIAAQVSQ